jgi:hypothetical protein
LEVDRENIKTEKVSEVIHQQIDNKSLDIADGNAPVVTEIATCDEVHEDYKATKFFEISTSLFNFLTDFLISSTDFSESVEIFPCISLFILLDSSSSITSLGTTDTFDCTDSSKPGIKTDFNQQIDNKSLDIADGNAPVVTENATCDEVHEDYNELKTKKSFKIVRLISV